MSASWKEHRLTSAGITLLTPLTALGPAWLRAQFAATRRLPWLRGLEPFRFVYTSHWVVLDDLPYDGVPQVREAHDQRHLLWEVVYSAELDPYVEAFVVGIQPQIDRVWSTSVGFPRKGSVRAVTDYITSRQAPEGVTWWAYGHASVRQVLAALEVAREHCWLIGLAESQEPGADEAFARAYASFLRRKGALL